MPTVVPISALDDPRLAVFAGMRDAELRHRVDPGQTVLGSTGVFMAEGDLVVERLIHAAGLPDRRFAVRSVLCTPTRRAAMQEMLARLPESVPVYEVNQATMNGAVGFNMHRGMLAVGEVARELAVTDLVGRSRLLLLLEDLVNHDNIGSLFRSAAALGGRGTGVLLSPRCADPLYRKSLRVSMGHVLSVPYARVEARDWPGVLAVLRDGGWRVAAMTPAPGSIELGEFVGSAATGHLAGLALVLGTEGTGLSAGALANSEYKVRIDIAEGVDSLNVGVAGAIALHRLGDPQGAGRGGLK